MSKRRSITGSGSRRLFTATADKTHPRNLLGNPMRGGIRL